MLTNNKIVAFVPIKDTARSKTFYANTLGLKFLSDDGFALVFDANGNMLRLVKVQDWDPPQFTILGWEVTDIEDKVKELQKSGVEFQKYPWMPQDQHAIWNAPGGARIAWFKDPDGNVLSISQHP